MPALLEFGSCELGSLGAVCRSADRQSPSLSGDEERKSGSRGSCCVSILLCLFASERAEGNKRGLGARLKPLLATSLRVSLFRCCLSAAHALLSLGLVYFVAVHTRKSDYTKL